MSLLSGIKFVPKQERHKEDPGGRRDRPRKKRSRTTHHSSDSETELDSIERSASRRKRIKSSKHKHNQYKGHRSKEGDSGDSDNSRGADKRKKKNENISDDSESVDMEAIALRELQREREERSKQQRQEESSGVVDNHEKKKHVEKTFDRNRFRSLIDSLKGRNAESSMAKSVELAKESTVAPKQSQRAESPPANELPNDIDHSANETIDYEDRQITSSGPPASITMPSNQSAAALLRQRLRTGNKPRTDQVIAGMQDCENFDASTDVNLQRSIFQIKHQQHRSAHSQSRKNTKMQSYSDIGKDSNVQELLQEAKRTGGDDDIDNVFRRNIMRLGDRYQGTELGTGGAFGGGDRAGRDEDDGEIDMRMFRRSGAGSAEQTERETQNLIQQAFREKQRMQQTVARCMRCTGSTVFPRNCTVVQSEHVVLCLPPDPYALTTLHCQLIPLLHKPSLLQCGDEVANEIERFKKCIRRMHEANGKGTLFVESAIGFYRRPHCCIDAIPLEQGIEAEVKMSFREAFTMCEDEWSQHKKIIELTKTRPLSRAIPSHFEYLMAEWGDPDNTSADGMTYGGMAHPVESSAEMDADFCLDVLSGLFDVEPLKLRKKIHAAAQRGCSGTQKQRDGTVLGRMAEDAVLQFKEQWSCFDWTQYVD